MTYTVWEQKIEMQYGEMVEASERVRVADLDEIIIDREGYDVVGDAELQWSLQGFTGEITLWTLIDQEIDEEIGHVLAAY